MCTVLMISSTDHDIINDARMYLFIHRIISDDKRPRRQRRRRRPHKQKEFGTKARPTAALHKSNKKMINSMGT